MIEERMSSEELGVRLRVVLGDLLREGVAYREAYGSDYEQTYPHNCFLFSIIIDRSGTEIQMVDGCAGQFTSEGLASVRNQEDIAVELLEALEQSLQAVRKIKVGDDDD